MAEDPSDPPPAASSDAGVAHELSAEVHPTGTPERFGPVTLQRFTKGDGRALILYEPTPPDAPGA